MPPSSTVDTSTARSSLTVETVKGDDYWVARWRDDLGRLVKRQLVKASNLSVDDYKRLVDRLVKIRGLDERSKAVLLKQRSRTVAQSVARELAFKEYEHYQHTAKVDLQVRNQASAQELEACAQVANFPRAVVAHHIQIIFKMLALSGQSSPLQSFAERTGISDREVYRIIDDQEKVWVGAEIVDRMCCEFDLLYDEMIDDSFAWAERTGVWQERPGAPDSWPIGYFDPKRAARLYEENLI